MESHELTEMHTYTDEMHGENVYADADDCSNCYGRRICICICRGLMSMPVFVCVFVCLRNMDDGYTKRSRLYSYACQLVWLMLLLFDIQAAMDGTPIPCIYT